MTERSRYHAEYKWLQTNPSNETALPVIFASIFEDNGVLAWASDGTAASNEMLVCAQELYLNEYPKLFKQAESLMALKLGANSFADIENITKQYKRGVTIALLALEAVTPGGTVEDLKIGYTKKLEEVEINEKIDWLHNARQESFSNASQLYEFIATEYATCWKLEDYESTAVMYGAINAYILQSHARACRMREEEECWRIHDDLPENRPLIAANQLNYG